MSVIARDGEVRAAVGAVRAARGVVLTGDPGVGKTVLARAVAERAAREAGLTAVPVVATEAGRSTPFGALAGLVPEDLGGVHPGRVPHLLAGALSGALLVVDDAPLLDEHSAAALLTLVTRGSVRAVLTARSGADAPDAVTALWKDGLLERHEVRPLDRGGTAALLGARLGGEVAASTTDLLWRRTGGNPLFLDELVRSGRETGRLRPQAGVWWWSGTIGAPDRLVDLLSRRLRELGREARDAVDVLALGEPLPYETLAAVVAEEAVLELEDRGVLTSHERAGVLLVRFAHPLLHAVAAARLTPARRRWVARRLRTAPAGHVELLRRATWEEAAGGTPDVPLLLRAAASVVVSEPALSALLAERALPHDPGPGAALALCDARAELGERDAALEALRVATARAVTADDRLAAGFARVSLTCWTLRRPDDALAAGETLAAALPEAEARALRSAAPMLALFAGRPADAERMAAATLAGRPAAAPDRAWMRARTVQLAVAALADRTGEAAALSAELTEALARGPAGPYSEGFVHAFTAMAQLFGTGRAALPAATGRGGRWPGGPPAEDDPGAPWPLLAGLSRHVRGDWHGAVTPLREALVQQRDGEGLFRSEAAACLVVALAAAGRADEAAALLASDPPDAVAVLPGLGGWARSAVAAAAGEPRAGRPALGAADEAAAAGAPNVAAWYLLDAARAGSAAPAAQAADRLPQAPRSRLTAARLGAVHALAAGRPAALLAAAEDLAALGADGYALDLAARAAAGRDDVAARRAVALAAACRRALGLPAEHRQDRSAVLTRRELEVARLAAKGLQDRDIAERLVVSVRTVESHLAAAYRKLEISSRRELAAAL